MTMGRQFKRNESGQAPSPSPPSKNVARACLPPDPQTIGLWRIDTGKVNELTSSGTRNINLISHRFFTLVLLHS